MTDTKHTSKTNLLKSVIARLKKAQDYDYDSDLIFDFYGEEINALFRALGADAQELAELDRGNPAVLDLLTAVRNFNTFFTLAQRDLDALIPAPDSPVVNAEALRDHIANNLSGVGREVATALTRAKDLYCKYGNENSRGPE